jgi:hypothetical protein
MWIRSLSSMSTRGLLPLGLIVLMGCGDEEDAGGACVVAEACGGDVTGQWALESLCFSQAQGATTFENGLPAGCQGSFVEAEAEVDGGLLDYGADGAFTTAGTARARSEYRFALPCLRTALPDLEAGSVTGFICTNIANDLLADLALINPGEGTTSCSVENDACTCESTATFDAASTGSYAIDDDQIVVGSSSAPYCASGDRLQLGSGTLGGTAFARRL